MGLSSKQVSSDGLNWEDEFKLHSSGLIEVPKRRQTNIQQLDPLPCPRCDSKNTKFCYYNNYNKSQPRHYCKACKRHWTKGGTLRNVPVGGGRKNKRLKIATTFDSSITAKNHNRQHTQNLSLALSDQNDVFGIMSPGSSVNRGNSVNLEFSDNPSVLPFFHSQISPFTFSSLCPFQVESTPSLNVDNTPLGLSSLEDTITIMPSTTCSPSQTWQAPMKSDDVDVPSYWNWDTVDPLVLADQLNINWDDSHEIKP